MKAGPHLVLGAGLHGLRDGIAWETQLHHLIDHIIIHMRVGGDGVCLHHGQVPRQVQPEPGVLPADQLFTCCLIII